MKIINSLVECLGKFAIRGKMENIDDQGNREVLFILENLGHLPKGFDGNVLIPFIHSANEDIRFWAVKNIGKISNPKVIDILAKITSNDKDTMVNQLDAVGIVCNKLKTNTSETM